MAKPACVFCDFSSGVLIETPFGQVCGGCLLQRGDTYRDYAEHLFKGTVPSRDLLGRLDTLLETEKKEL